MRSVCSTYVLLSTTHGSIRSGTSLSAEDAPASLRLSDRQTHRGKGAAAGAFPRGDGFRTTCGNPHLPSPQAIFCGYLKPTHLFLGASGDLCLNLPAPKKRLPELTLPAHVIRYASPEWINSGSASPQSDLYSFGLVLYRLFTGYEPYLENDPNLLLRKQVLSYPAPSPEIESRHSGKSGATDSGSHPKGPGESTFFGPPCERRAPG